MREIRFLVKGAGSFFYGISTILFVQTIIKGEIITSKFLQLNIFVWPVVTVVFFLIAVCYVGTNWNDE